MYKKLCLFLITVSFSASVSAQIVTKEVSYKQGDTNLKGFVAYDDSIKGKRPGVLVVHEWWGQNDYARKRATMLAEMGYTAFALDMYGDGKTVDHPKDASMFSKAVGGNLPLAKARFEAAIDALKKESTVRSDDIAALGYCFGGGILINMARLGTDIDAVLSYHGSVGTSSPAMKGDIKTKIRVFNGADDKFIKTEQITAFKQEMEAAGADYEFINYPGAVHSFTNPGSTAIGKKFNLPLAYNEAADKDSWARTKAFLKATFAD